MTDDRVVLTDWDGTLRDGFTLVDWAHHLVAREVIVPELVETIDRAVAEHSLGRLDYLGFAELAVREFGLAVTGLSAKVLEHEAQLFNRGDRKVFAFTEPLLRRLTPHFRVVVVSGAPAEVLQAYLAPYPGVVVRGVELEFSDRKAATGRVRSNPALTRSKAAIAESLLRGERAIGAIGDSEADRPLFDVAEIGIIMGKGLQEQVGENVIRIDPLSADESVADLIASKLLAVNS